MLESLFSKVSDLKACNFIKKETPTRVFPCEYSKVFKNSFFYRTPSVAASVLNTYELLLLYWPEGVKVFFLQLFPKLKLANYLISIKFEGQVCVSGCVNISPNINY